ncbi:hypothetical protein CMI47_06785 [Candidatus Pacearchaeota archaeon]|nr:hypothetical protein [Candidatus Pacearchaeota archaeon]
MKNPVSDDPKKAKEANKGRLFRGGGWDYPASHARVSDRFSVSPYFRYSNLGFRVVRNKPKGKK